MKPAVAGTILFLLWLVIMVMWGESKHIEPVSPLSEYTSY